ncbi:Putative ribonuclease H protein At1g65750 [Linum perenne]
MTNSEGQWDYQRLERLLAPKVVDVVTGMSPPQENRGEDDWVWGLERSGLFLIKSAYNLICQTDSISVSNPLKVVWRWEVLNRIQHFLWFAKDKILTNDVRCRRGFSQDANCNWCNTVAETTSHVLHDCSLGNATWMTVGGFDTNGPKWQLLFANWFKLFHVADRGLKFGIVC